MPTPTPGQKIIPIKDWNRFLRMADWYERTVEQGKGTLRPIYGKAMIVKTPEGGIPARDGDTIFSVACLRCVAAETGTGGEKTFHTTDEELVVFNPDTTDVAEDSFVKTALSGNGTRYVDQSSGGAPATIRFEITAAGPFLGDLGTPECDSVVADVLGVSCSGAGVEVDDEVIIWDPSRCNFNIPLEVLIGAHGWATQMTNDTEGATDCLYDRAAEGSCYWNVSTLCCTEDIYA